MKKSATITFHCSYNYGSVLQAFALQRFLQNNGIENDIIDYRSVDFEQYRIIPTRYSKKSINTFLRTLFFLPKYLKRKNSFQSFLHSMLNCTRKIYYNVDELSELNGKYDAFICGSDQIWNLDCTGGVNPVYFLKFVGEGKKKIAYAPSLAKGEFKRDYSKEIKNALVGFNAISVREENTIPLIQGLTDKKVFCVLDPTLLLLPENYPMIKPRNIVDGSEYIFVYMLGYDENLIEYCKKLREEKNLPIFYLMGMEDIKYHKELAGKDVFGATPEEFLYYIAHAKYVLTTSFHATVFSILFQRQFCTFHRKNTWARTSSLLDALNIRERSYGTDFEIDKEINYKEVFKKLSIMKRDSVNYLLNALNVE